LRAASFGWSTRRAGFQLLPLIAEALNLLGMLTELSFL
jgi:nitric oxide synthase oxygenase domain/subunit